MTVIVGDKIVVGYKLGGMLTLDTPWEELLERPELQGFSPEQLEVMKVEYQELQTQASVVDNDEMLPWFPFMMTSPVATNDYRRNS